MPPRPRPPCVVCHHEAPKYACASCRANYCSVACYKQHRETCSSGSALANVDTTPVTDANVTLVGALPDSDPNPNPESNDLEPLQDPTPLRPLTSLKWPYVPDTSAYPDPLTRDDPKPLQLYQYEAIATSPTIRTLLTSHPRLRTLLTSIDALRGPDREHAIRRALGVDKVDGRSGHFENKNANAPPPDADTDTHVFRELAEVIEHAVRDGREEALGLDWDQEDQNQDQRA